VGPVVIGELTHDGKHIGESFNVPMLAVIANMVIEAVGVRNMDLT
jgi:hypothetical protein